MGGWCEVGGWCLVEDGMRRRKVSYEPPLRQEREKLMGK